MSKVIRREILASIDYLLRDLVAVRNHDDEDAGSAKRHELEMLQHSTGRARQRESDVLRRACNEV